MPQFDTCWVQVAGESAPNYIRKYADRQEIVHLKDYAGSRTENMYGLIGLDEDKEKDAPTAFELRPVGKGVQDFPAILAACEEVDMLWVVVEQDSPAEGDTPMASIEASINYLKTLNY